MKATQTALANVIWRQKCRVILKVLVKWFAELMLLRFSVNVAVKFVKLKNSALIINSASQRLMLRCAIMKKNAERAKTVFMKKITPIVCLISSMQSVTPQKIAQMVSSV